jgi:hypothetical protein
VDLGHEPVKRRSTDKTEPTPIEKSSKGIKEVIERAKEENKTITTDPEIETVIQTEASK